MKNQVLTCYDIFNEVKVLTCQAKSLKCEKSRGVVLVLWDWEDLVIKIRKGCSVIGDEKSIICDLDKELRWYMIRSEVKVFGPFLKSDRKVGF